MNLRDWLMSRTLRVSFWWRDRKIRRAVARERARLIACGENPGDPVSRQQRRHAQRRAEAVQKSLTQ
jgi:hypothetical protein